MSKSGPRSGRHRPPLSLVLALALLPDSALAARTERDVLREAASVASAVMSPFCPGRTLSACPSPRAAEWRAEIGAWVAEGVPRDEIVQRLQARVPDLNLTSDRNALYGWIAPALALLVLGALVLGVGRRLLRGRRHERPDALSASAGPGPSAATTDDPALAPYTELLEAELRRD